MLKATQLTKNYHLVSSDVHALKDITFELPSGESMAVVGASGAGKSTLLTLLGGLDEPDSGDVIFDDTAIHRLNDQQLADFRSKKLGFVFQFHHLLQDFDVLHNVMLPLLVQNVDRATAKTAACAMMEKVGLAGKEGRYPLELSGGEQQRAAIARGLVHKPRLILADEPTGNLDETNGEHVFELLCQLNRDLGATLIVVTHHPTFAEKLNYTLTLDKGRLKSFEQGDAN